jgi:hypothetical protein
MQGVVRGNHFRILGLLLQYAYLSKVFVASVFLLTTLGNTCLDKRQLSSDYISGIAKGVAALRRRFS